MVARIVARIVDNVSHNPSNNASHNPSHNPFMTRNDQKISALKEIQKISDEKNFKQGEIIFKEGDIHPNFYLILKGTVEISKKTTDGNSKVIAEIGEGEFLGEGALSGTTKKPATAVATSDVIAMSISVESFEKLMEKDPKTVVDFLLSVLAGANNRLAETNTNLMALYEMSQLMHMYADDLNGLANGIIEKLVAITDSKDGIFLLKNPFSESYRVIYSSSKELDLSALNGYDLGRTQNLNDEKGRFLIVNLKDMGNIVLRRSAESAEYDTHLLRLVTLVADQAANTVKEASEKASLKAKKLLERKHFDI
jgi:CRP-like cAMP-binding protein